jgi:hypothetical protein
MAYHAAVWTGTEMIVWGNFAGRYRPSTNSWTSMPATDAVSGGDSAFAAWTGAEMIVFRNGSTGGRYNPSTNAWTTTSAYQGAPTGTGFTAVWTGSELIRWGGGGVNTGNRYNPSTDSWAATSIGTNVPQARSYHTAVWTGEEMVVWGGSNENDPSYDLRAGARYDPTTDSWTAMSTGADPRMAHTAVWTGRQMIAWGGFPENINVWLYCACPNGLISFRDLDGDGYGDASVSNSACEGTVPSGYVVDNSDCNDANASVHPGAVESCNGLDDSCDFIVDNGGSSLCDDNNACTNDACGGVAGCGHANNTAACDDGNACTTGDACAGGICAGTGGAVPAEVSSVSASKSATTATFDWSAIAGAITYDVLRGRVRDWPVGSNPATETCFGDVVLPSASDASEPPVDDGYCYLVRAENACGNGGYGSQAVNGVPTVPRLSGTCP